MTTLTELNQELLQVKQLQSQRERLQRRQVQVQSSLQAEQARLADLERQLKKEGLDVERLEKLSLTGLFYTLLGSKEQQIEQERQEFLAAQLKHAQSRHAVSSLEGELADLGRQLERLQDVPERYQAVMRAKERLLAQSPDATGQRLVELTEQIATVQSELREIEEAQSAGRSAYSGLQNMIDALGSASAWGVWDMLGGGILSTAVKHARIDDARYQAQQVQQSLGRFRRELSDVSSGPLLPQDEISGFETFADYFFDGLIIDWVVQSKIDRSLETTRNAAMKVDSVLEKLDKQQKSVHAHLDGLQREKQDLLESA